MAPRFLRLIITAWLIMATGAAAIAQNPMKRMPMGGGFGRGGGGASGDSIQFEKRNFKDDSATIRFRYLDSARYNSIDSSIRDYFDKVPLDAEHIHLGNNGTATRSLLFTPYLQAGWDPGFHAYDIYAFKVNDTHFMTTTKPYTRLTYLLGSRAEQQIGLDFTQNISPDWNFAFQYRLINAPGFYNSQAANHKNFRFSTFYTSKGKRYNAFFIALGNGLQSSENGGIKNDTFLVNQNPAYNDLYNIPTNLAVIPYSSRNFFNVKLQVGNKYNMNTILLRQQYDFGKKDSTITDSTVYRFFLPKFRIEHTINYSTFKYRYLDVQGLQDSAFYNDNYGLPKVADTVNYQDKWNFLSNDFSLVQFPDSKNPLQFLKLGAELQLISGKFALSTDNFYDVKLHAEYRNRTKNRKWDMLLYGEFYAMGQNLGNYDIQAHLKRYLGKKWGQLELGFRNVNRTPSYVFMHPTSFPSRFSPGLNPENTFQIYGYVDNPKQRLRLSGEYYLMGNYAYFENFNQVKQESSIFNLLRVGLNKEFSLRNHWKWYIDLYLQTLTGSPPLNVPLVYARNRFAYEGSVFRNLVLSTGFDIRYNTPYKAANYSPLLGQYFYQDQVQISMRPDIAAYVNFRIRNFMGFTRLENLNTLTFRNGFGFKYNNLSAPLYPYPGLLFRFGVVWDLLN